MKTNSELSQNHDSGYLTPCKHVLIYSISSKAGSSSFGNCLNTKTWDPGNQQVAQKWRIYHFFYRSVVQAS